MAVEQFLKTTSSSRIKLNTPVILMINTKPWQSPLANPFRRGFLRWIGLIHRSHPMGGANITPW
jgi:hypothetical protein